jgi:hypothetical protein
MHQSLARRERRNHMDRLLRPFFDRRDVLPSMAITSDGIPVSAATHAMKHRWNCLASSVARMSPRWSWEGVPSRNGRNRRNSSSFFLAEPGDVSDRLRPGKHCQKAQEQHLVRSITTSRNANQRITTDSALQPFVTLFFTRSPWSPPIECQRRGFIRANALILHESRSH